MSALPVPETIDLMNSGDEGAGSPVHTIDLTESDDEGAGSPVHQASDSQGSPSKRKAPATDDDEDRPIKKSRSPTPPDMASLTEQAVHDTASATTSDKVIDLTDGDEGPPLKRSRSPASRSPDSPTKRKAPLTDGDEGPPPKRSHSPATPPATSSAERFVDTTVGATVSGNAPTANVKTRRNKALYDLPELAPRFHTTYSTEEQVEYKNPNKFCIKPAFFIRWQAHDYINLAEHMRYQFNPVAFARASDKPVEEVSLIASRLIFNPLYEASEAMKLGETAVQQVLGLFKKCPTPSRPWGDKTIKGELDGVKTGGSLRIILDDGSLKYLNVDELDLTDTKYLDLTLSKGDWMLFYGRDEEAHEEMINKMNDAAKEAKEDADEGADGGADEDAGEDADEDAGEGADKDA